MIRCPPAAKLGFNDAETTSRLGMHAADDCRADAGEVAAWQAIAKMRCEATPYEVVHCHLDLVVDSHRRRLARIEHGALPGEQFDRAERTGVARTISVRDVLEDHL